MKVEFDHSFLKSLRKLKDVQLREKVEQLILSLERTDSLSKISSVQKIVGFKSYYRVRIGDYRLGLEKLSTDSVRLIVIAHRKDIYDLFP
jgi:mRNA interferase RelE/StbE